MISVVIPSFNRRDCLLRLLRDIHSQNGAYFEVIVVDDCSSDDSVDAIRREFPEVILLVNAENGGPCVSRNRGIRAAKGSLIVGFDSDVTIHDRFLLAGVATSFQANPEISGLAFRILKPDGSSEDRKRWWHPAPIEFYADKSFMTSYFSGTGYAFRKDLMIGAGLFAESFYMHYEEVELAFRILDGGGIIQYQPELQVIHHEGETSGRSRVQLYYKPRNQILLALSCFPFPRAVVYLVPRLVFQMAKALIFRHMSLFLRALQDGFAEGRKQSSLRRPLKNGTLLRLRRLRNGLAKKKMRSFV